MRRWILVQRISQPSPKGPICWQKYCSALWQNWLQQEGCSTPHVVMVQDWPADSAKLVGRVGWDRRMTERHVSEWGGGWNGFWEAAKFNCNGSY